MEVDGSAIENQVVSFNTDAQNQGGFNEAIQNSSMECKQNFRAVDFIQQCSSAC